MASAHSDDPADSLDVKPSAIAPLLRPIQAFMATESAGGILLMLATVVALAWANSPWGHAYESLWHTYAGVTVGGHAIKLSLEHWVNDGLMVIFFLLVGLEIKRELLTGELASVRQATLPAVAAVGGMIVPAGIFALLNARGPGHAGWGIPMATDIAFAVGVLAIVGRSVPTALKVFLLAVAIVDDLGAVLVIAFFYTSSVSLIALAIAGGFLAALVALNLARVHSPLPYLVLGVGLWIATFASGIHATIAGVLLAFTIPASRALDEAPYVDYMERMVRRFRRDATTTPDKLTADQTHALHSMELAAQAVQTPLARIEHALLKPVGFVIVPIFALANAGVDLRSVGGAAFANPVTWGVVLGLLLGKPIGILLSSWLAIRLGVAALPSGARWPQMFGVSLLCGIGFTMSLFVANLAYPGEATMLAAAKVGILMASATAAIAGGIAVARARKSAAFADESSSG